MLVLLFSRFQWSLFFTIALLLGNASSAVAQTPITLSEAINQAKQSNHSVMLAKQSIAVQQAGVEQSKARFRPYLGFQVTDVATNNPLNVFGSKLMQSAVVQEDFNPALLNDPDLYNNLNIGLSAMMPLYNPVAREEHKAAQSQVAMKQAMAQRTQEGIELEVTKAYYMLLLTQNSVAVLEETKDAADSNYAQASNYFDEGLMLKSDLLDMQLMVNQSALSLASAKTSFAKAQAYFNFVLNTDAPTEFIPTEKLSEVADLTIQAGELNTNRADLQAMKAGIEALGFMKASAGKAFYPKVQAFGGYDINSEVPFQDVADNYHVGVQLKWDLYQGNMRKASQVKAKAEQDEKILELNKMKAEASLEIENTKREILDIISQIELNELSISQADESLRIRKNRFSQGLEKSTDIINSETQLSQKKLARLNSLFELNMKSAYLDMLLK